MTHNKNVNPFTHTRTPSTHPGNTLGIRRFIGMAALAGLTSLAATLTLSHAAPPAHASASERAQNNFAEEKLPTNARAKQSSNEEWARGRILVTPRAGLPAKA
ncbi:hypothetical protein, partial [Nitrosomonas sp. ANs5]|uniref:hypothetical protein n=1 Tax=Nitrosomonas sp. ANs5 TaxID=3423941 RepID=UPI003D343C6E